MSSFVKASLSKTTARSRAALSYAVISPVGLHPSLLLYLPGIERRMEKAAYGQAGTQLQPPGPPGPEHPTGTPIWWPCPFCPSHGRVEGLGM